MNKKIVIPLLIILILGGYFGYRQISKNKNQDRYILAKVERGDIMVTVSGSGQISAFDQIDIKPEITGKVVGIYVKEGEEIKKGALIFKLDDKDYQKAVRDASNSLELSKLELEKLLKPADELEVLQAENALSQAKEAKEIAEKNLIKKYEDGYNTTGTILFELPKLLSFLAQINPSLWLSLGNISYDSISSQINKNIEDYKILGGESDREKLDGLFDETYETLSALKRVIEATDNLSYINQINTYYSTIYNLRQEIQQLKNTLASCERSVEEKTLSLKKLKEGPDELDIKAKKIVIRQKEDALKTAKDNLSKCYIYSPLDGRVSIVNVKNGDYVSPSIVLATVITDQKVAEITLNELDVAKVKIGNKATLTFDALPELTLTGRVVEMDIVGTINQGVSSYGVKIALDSDNEEIKPGMTTNAEIFVETKLGVLAIPNSALKSQGDSNYVELIDADEKTKNQLKIGTAIVLPKNVKIKQETIEIGVSNENLTEVISGLNEGDIIISSKISSTNKTTQTKKKQLFQIPGMGGGGAQMRMR
jgi:HlyD family secretion protein